MNAKKELTLEQQKEIQDFYDNTPNIKKVAKHFHISYSVLRRYIKFKKRIKSKRIRNTEQYRIKIKKSLIEYKGGKCEICGYNKYYGALDFHHINPSDKSFNISGGTKSFNKLQKEVDKCILVCSNCHREIHGGIIDIQQIIKNP